MTKKDLLKKGSDTWKEYKEFILRGNIFDMAVGVIIGSAFGKIVTSLVNDILMPMMGVIIGGINLKTLNFRIGDSIILYGSFLQNIIDFLIIAACIFLVTKLMSMLKKKEEVKEEIEEEKTDEQTLLLREIRDLLKNQTKQSRKAK